MSGDRQEYVTITFDVLEHPEAVDRDLRFLCSEMRGQVITGSSVKLQLHIAYYQEMASKLQALTRILDAAKITPPVVREYNHKNCLVADVFGRLEQLRQSDA